jgi:hypothetical protein
MQMREADASRWETGRETRRHTEAPPADMAITAGQADSTFRTPWLSLSPAQTRCHLCDRVLTRSRTRRRDCLRFTKLPDFAHPSSRPRSAAARLSPASALRLFLIEVSCGHQQMPRTSGSGRACPRATASPSRMCLQCQSSPRRRASSTARLCYPRRTSRPRKSYVAYCDSARARRFIHKGPLRHRAGHNSRSPTSPPDLDWP